MAVWMAAAQDAILGIGATAAGGTTVTAIAVGVTDVQANGVGGIVTRTTVGRTAMATIDGETLAVGGIATSIIAGATIIAGAHAITGGGSRHFGFLGVAAVFSVSL